jgi:hypothetical protein
MHRSLGPSKHIGSIGEILTLHTVSLLRANGPRNRVFCFVFQDQTGNIFSVWSRGALLEVGQLYDLKGVVKKHSIFNAVKQTELINIQSERIIQ